MRRFSVGEVVTWIPDLLLRWETHGDYRIVAAMPDHTGVAPQLNHAAEPATRV